MKLFIYIALTCILACAFSQGLKILINARLNKIKPSIKLIFSDGDYPSSHTSFICALTTLSWLYTLDKYITMGESTYEMWISVVLSALMVVIIRDAIGVRYTVQKLCESVSSITMLVNNTSNKNHLARIREQLNLKSGHRPYEIFGGIINGILVALFTSTIYYEWYPLITAVVVLYSIYIILSMWFVKKKRG